MAVFLKISSISPQTNLKLKCAKSKILNHLHTPNTPTARKIATSSQRSGPTWVFFTAITLSRCAGVVSKTRKMISLQKKIFPSLRVKGHETDPSCCCCLLAYGPAGHEVPQWALPGLAPAHSHSSTDRKPDEGQPALLMNPLPCPAPYSPVKLPTWGWWWQLKRNPPKCPCRHSSSCCCSIYLRYAWVQLRLWQGLPKRK